MPEQEDIVTLLADKQVFGGWMSMKVNVGIEQLSGSFDLDVSERWPGQAERRSIKPGTPVQVLLGTDPVITGHTDDVRIQFDAARTHQLQVSGRDKTGDLVDCMAEHKSGQWANANLKRIAEDLCAPFGIKVIVDTDIGAKFSTWNIQPSETAYECLERAARMRGVLMHANSDGNLVIARAGTETIDMVLEEGKNIEHGTVEWSHRERYSTYTVMSQGRMDDFSSAESGIHAKAVVKDELITRYRPYIALSEDQGEQTTLRQRAQWEKSVRMGRGRRGQILVKGWRHTSDLWRPNRLVHVRSQMMNLDAPMLITACEYRQSIGSGTTTQLTITRREAFERVEGAALQRLNKKMGGQRWREKKEDEELDWGFE